jgi:hypothetical protein
MFEHVFHAALLGLLLNGLGNLLLKTRINVDNVPAKRHYVQPPNPKISFTPLDMMVSTNKKNSADKITITKTMPVETMLSLRVGHVTLDPS